MSLLFLVSNYATQGRQDVPRRPPPAAVLPPPLFRGVAAGQEGVGEQGAGRGGLQGDEAQLGGLQGLEEGQRRSQVKNVLNSMFGVGK